jgi:hypothetical protein
MGEKEFNLLSRTESSWSNSVPRLISNSREVHPLHTSEYVPSHGPLPPSSDHRYPECNLEEWNEYALAPASQSLGQWPGRHTFSSDHEDLRLEQRIFPALPSSQRPKRRRFIAALDTTTWQAATTFVIYVLSVVISSTWFPPSRAPSRWRHEYMNSKTRDLSATTASIKSWATTSKGHDTRPWPLFQRP